MKILEIKVECRSIYPHLILCTQIRRKYCLLGINVYTTDWFSLSQFWPGMTASIKELQKAGAIEVKDVDISV